VSTQNLKESNKKKINIDVENLWAPKI